MEAKGLEYSEYITKESLAQQGGYGLTNKGPQHDEAWLIFMDQVNNQLPTFEDKAEALHYFPMWRTWFGLCGFCKLPWNDVVDPKNAESDEPAKIPHHVQNYVEIFSAVTGREVVADDLIAMSERVYNFQRVFNIRLGKGLREHDAMPYRSMGPVTEAEYLSRQERYDAQLREWLDLDPDAMTLSRKNGRPPRLPRAALPTPHRRRLRPSRLDAKRCTDGGETTRTGDRLRRCARRGEKASLATAVSRQQSAISFWFAHDDLSSNRH